jgi:hypothetical protein
MWRDDGFVLFRCVLAWMSEKWVERVTQKTDDTIRQPDTTETAKRRGYIYIYRRANEKWQWRLPCSRLLSVVIIPPRPSTRLLYSSYQRGKRDWTSSKNGGHQTTWRRGVSMRTRSKKPKPMIPQLPTLLYLYLLGGAMFIKSAQWQCKLSTFVLVASHDCIRTGTKPTLDYVHGTLTVSVFDPRGVKTGKFLVYDL